MWTEIKYKKQNQKQKMIEKQLCCNCSKELDSSFIEKCKNCGYRFCLECRLERNKYFFCSKWCQEI